MLPRSVAKVNSVLMLHPEAPLTIADVARASELKYTPAASALATLERRGLIRRVRRLGQDAFEPNRDDPHYPMAYGTAVVDLPLAEALGGEQIQAVFAYGSLARPGGGNAGSDLDLLIEMAPERTLLDVIAIKQDLEELLGCKVDVVTEAAISSYLREHVLAESVQL